MPILDTLSKKNRRIVIHKNNYIILKKAILYKKVTKIFQYLYKSGNMFTTITNLRKDYIRKVQMNENKIP